VTVVSLPVTITYLSFGWRIFAAVRGASMALASSWSISPCMFARSADEAWNSAVLSSSDGVGVGSRKARASWSFCDHL
jgi:hypothetical protein